ncbi:acetate--CoA ligase family protein [Acrocarpospora sp. B8E8]|uniref:acetate--CoA ligase family protein n=1 Tax=Acrocarpospora sp. B8E8 TaxID=3153572 RepID=UPI00325E8FBD
MNGLFDPCSVAVVGASDDPAKWGYWLAKGALRGVGRREVYLINGRAGQVQGQHAYRQLSDLPKFPELVAIVTPPASYEAVVEDALSAGARYLVGITAGVDRAYPGGHAALAARVRAAGARLLGPTCMGVYDGATDLALTWGSLTPGPIGVVSQSGSVGLEIGYLATRAGLGLSRFVSVGAQADLTTADLLDPVITAPNTRVVILYLEDLSLGRSLITFADRARALGKRVILLAVGGSAAGERAINSHTGALATPDTAVNALCDAAGVIRVHTPAQAVNAAQICLAGLPSRKPRLAVVADSGGQGALAAEFAERAGLEVPALSPETIEVLAKMLPADAGLANPIDLAGAGEADLGIYPRVAHAVAADVDVVLLTGYFGAYAADSPALRDIEETAARDLPWGRCLVHTMRTDGPTTDILRRGGFPVFDTIDDPINALAATFHANEGIRPTSDPAPGEAHDTRPAPEAVTGIGLVRQGPAGGGLVPERVTGIGPVRQDPAGGGLVPERVTGIGPVRQDPAGSGLAPERVTGIGPAHQEPADGGLARAGATGIGPAGQELADGGLVGATDMGPAPSENADVGPVGGVDRIRAELVARGVVFPEGGFAATADEAARLAARLGGTVVLKAVGPVHKTEVGGVVLGLTSAGAVHERAVEMGGRLELAGFWVERQVGGGVELIVGAYRDREVGVLVTVGSGGVLAELVADTATALGPLDHEGALRLIGRTKAARMLDGWRGAPPCDRDAVARVVVAVGQVLAAHPELSGVELNPLLARPRDSFALDLLATLRDP